MAPDLIRCPGCGVKMDLSTFAIRPDQVICPRCSTRAAVSPLASPVAASGGFAYPPAPASFASGQRPIAAAAPSYMSPAAYTAQTVAPPAPSGYSGAPSMPLPPQAAPSPSISWPLGAPAAAPGVASAPLPAPRPAVQPAPLPQAAPRPFSMPKPASAVAAPAADPFGDSSFFNAATAKSLTDSTAILPIDAKGNAEPLAFALIGLLSVFLLFPPIGLALCLASLMMSSEEKRRGLYNSRRAAARFFAVLGLLANIALLAAEVYGIVSWVSDPPAVLGLFL